MKGLSCRRRVEPLTYIYGLNKTNKTTVIDAIKVALLGYYPAPGVPKTNAGVMELASSLSMSAGVTFSDDRTIQRNYSSDGKTNKVEVTGNYQPDPALALCLDPSLYFGKTDSERVQQVLALSEGPTANARIPAIKARFKMLRVKEHGEEAETALNQLMEEMPTEEAMTAQQWLATVLEWAKDQYKATNQSLKQFKGAGVALAEANAIDQLNAPQSLDELVQQLAGLRTKSTTEAMGWGRTKAKAEQIQKESTRRAALQRKQLELQAMVVDDETMKQYELKITSLRAEKESLLQKIEICEREMMDASEQSTTINLHMNEERDKVAELKGKIEEVERKILRLEISTAVTEVMKALVDQENQLLGRKMLLATNQKKLKEQISKLRSAPCCPTCKTIGESWKEGATLEFDQQLKAEENQLAELAPKLEQVTAQMTAEKDQAEKAKVEAIEKLRESQHADQEQITAANQRGTTYTNRLNIVKAKYRAQSEQTTELRNNIRKIDDSITALQKTMAEKGDAYARLFSITEELDNMQPLAEVPSIEEPESYREARRKVFEMEAQVATMQAQEAERDRIKQLNAIEAGLKAKLDLSKAIGETVKDEQSKIVDGAFGPVLALANQLVDGILPSPLVYHDGRVGRMRGQTFVGVGTFSGSEQRATYMAITAALAQQARDKIAIIDEIGTLDDPSRDKLLENLARALEQKMLDQVFIVGTTIPQTLPPSILVIDTSIAA